MKHLMIKSILALGASSVMLMAQATPPSQPPSSQGSQTSTDSQMVAKVRQAIAGDQTAGPIAHNVHVTAKNGMVTVRGKVNSEQEKDAVVAKAKQIAGDANVKDEITIAKSK